MLRFILGAVLAVASSALALAQTYYGTVGKWDTVISPSQGKCQATHSILLPDTRSNSAALLMIWVTQSNQPSGTRHDTTSSPDCVMVVLDLTKRPDQSGYATQQVWDNLLMNNINPNDPPNPITPSDPPEYDFECSGHAVLASGDIFFAGGQADPKESQSYDVDGHNLCAIFDSSAALTYNGSNDPVVWYAQDDDPMLDASSNDLDRYYPTCTTMAGGKVLVTSGHGDDPNSDDAEYAAIFDAGASAGQRWTLLNGTNAVFPDNPMPTYPFMFLRYPDGDMFFACSRHAFTFKSRDFDPAAPTSGWPRHPASGITNFPGVSAVTYYRRDGTTWHQYVMRAGGNTVNSGECGVCWYEKQVETIKVTDTSEPWRLRTAMGYPRDWFYLVPLPSKHVIALGGNTPMDPNDCDLQCDAGTSCQNYLDRLRSCFGSVLEAEWTAPTDHPNSQSWTELAAMPSSSSENVGGKGHHASALLLSDARVWIAGGEYSTWSDGDMDGTIDSTEVVNTEQKDALVFTPPYLYASANTTDPTALATRAVISSVAPVSPSADFVPSASMDVTLNTSNGVTSDKITDACLIRTGAATHSFDQNTRYVPLKIVSYPDSTHVRLKLPPSYSIIPPGPYMLFVSRERDPDNGDHLLVPSIAYMLFVAPIAL